MFLCNLKPYSDESLSSFIFRTAQENLMNELTWILLLFRDKYNYKIREDDINWLTKNELSQWSELLNTPKQQLEYLTYHHFCNRLNIPLGNELKSSWIMHHTTKVCPLCLEENPYHKLEWSMTHLTICRKHNTFLIDYCSECNRQLRPREAVSLKCSCKNEFLSSIPVIIASDQDVLSHQKCVHSCLEGTFLRMNDWINTTETYFRAIEWLASWIPQLLPFEDVPCIQDIKLTERVNTRHRLLRNKSWDQCVVIYSNAHELLSEWPLNYYLFLEKVNKIEFKSEISTFVNTSLAKLDETELEPIYREFLSFIKRINNIYINGTIIPKKQARVSLNCSNDSLQNHFIEITCSFAGLSLPMYREQEINNWKITFSDYITQEKLCDLYGIGKKVSREIIQANVFGQITTTKLGGVSSTLISLKKVNNIMLMLRTNATDLIGEQPTCTIVDFIHLFGHEIAPIVFQGLLNKDIPYTYDSTKKISNIKLVKHIAVNFIKRSIEQKASEKNIISIQELSVLLGVKISDVEYWINTGKFGIIKLKNNNIPYKSYISFITQYITTSQLSNQTGFSSKQILKKHSQGILESISGPKFNDGKRLLFIKDFTLKIITRISSH